MKAARRSRRAAGRRVGAAVRVGRRTRLLGSLALARALALAAGCEDAAVVEVRGPLDELRLRAYVDVARTAEERRDGLVGREGLAPSEGLLLEFPVEGEVCIQNGLVSFAVDAVFVDANDHVVAVEALPAGDPWVWCHAPVARVLEVAGRAALSVHVGDVLERRP